MTRATLAQDGCGNDPPRGDLDSPVGWVSPSVYRNALARMWAYRRQLLDNGIKPDLERYRRD